MKVLAAAFLSAASLTLSSGALAQQQDRGLYIGADVGQVDFEGEAKDTGFRFLGGYRFNRTLAAELGYAMLYDKDGVEATAWELVGVASFPIANRFSVFGKLGLAMWEAEGGGVKEDGTDLTYGVGVQYDLTPRFAIRGQWQRYDVDDADADVLSIGIIYKF